MRLLEFLTLFQIIALRNDGDGEVAGILNYLLSWYLPSKSGVEYLDNGHLIHFSIQLSLTLNTQYAIHMF